METEEPFDSAPPTEEELKLIADSNDFNGLGLRWWRAQQASFKRNHERARLGLMTNQALPEQEVGENIKTEKPFESGPPTQEATPTQDELDLIADSNNFNGLGLRWWRAQQASFKRNHRRAQLGLMTNQPLPDDPEVG